MTLKEFWDHIEKTKRRDPDEHFERLVARLAKLRVVDIVDFEHWWDQCIRDAFDWNLWGAAYIINDGCSDDCFHYFCCWLVLQGRDVFKAALKQPDSLAKVLDPQKDFTQGSSSPASDAFFRATGLPDTDKGYVAFEAAEQAVHGKREMMPDFKNEDWDHDDEEEMRKRFPRLWALYTEGEGDK